MASITASELWYWRASRFAVTAGARPAEATCAIIVLGFPTRRNGRPHAMQKWRTEIAVRSAPATGKYVLVFTGGRSRGAAVPEAQTMAACARRLSVPDNRILVETHALSTWQNIALTLPMADSWDTIVIASDPLHAARARRYAVAQRPDLAARLAPADNYRFLERCWLRVPVAGYELAALVRAWVRGRHQRTDRTGDESSYPLPGTPRRREDRWLSSGQDLAGR